MILTDKAHEAAKKQHREMDWHLYEVQKEFEANGYDREQISRLMDAPRGLLIELLDEIIEYNGLKAGELSAIDFDQLPRAVVRCRIASGMTQEEFAKKRDVSLAQLQKDERNEYFGFSAISAKRLILLAGYELQAIGMYQPVKKR